MNEDDVFDKWLKQADDELIASISGSIDADNVLATIKYHAATDPAGESADHAAEFPGRILDRIRSLSIIRSRHGTKRVIRAVRATLAGISQSKGFSAVLAAATVTAIFVVLLSPLPGNNSPLLSFPAISDRWADIGALGGTSDDGRDDDGSAQTGPGNDRAPDKYRVAPPAARPTSGRAEAGEPAPGQPARTEPAPAHRAPGEPTPGNPAPEEPTPADPRPERVPTAAASVTPGVHKEATVELSTQDEHKSVEIDSWQQVSRESDDLYIGQDGIFTALGAKLSVIDGSPEPTYHDCAQRPDWVNRVDFAGLQDGSRLCAQSHSGRYAVLTVITLPAPAGDGDRFVFQGKTWQLPGRGAPSEEPPPGQPPSVQPTPRQPPAPKQTSTRPPPPPPSPSPAETSPGSPG